MLTPLLAFPRRARRRVRIALLLGLATVAMPVFGGAIDTSGSASEAAAAARNAQPPDAKRRALTLRLPPLNATERACVADVVLSLVP